MTAQIVLLVAFAVAVVCPKVVLRLLSCYVPPVKNCFIQVMMTCEAWRKSVLRGAATLAHASTPHPGAVDIGEATLVLGIVSLVHRIFGTVVFATCGLVSAGAESMLLSLTFGEIFHVPLPSWLVFTPVTILVASMTAVLVFWAAVVADLAGATDLGDWRGASPRLKWLLIAGSLVITVTLVIFMLGAATYRDELMSLATGGSTATSVGSPAESIAFLQRWLLYGVDWSLFITALVAGVFIPRLFGLIVAVGLVGLALVLLIVRAALMVSMGISCVGVDLVRIAFEQLAWAYDKTSLK